MREGRRTPCSPLVAKVIAQTQRYVTSTDIRRAIISLGYPDTQGRIDNVIARLKKHYGWEGWSPVKGIMAYHAPGADWEEQRAARLAMGFTTPSGRRWRAAERCKGWAEVVDYIHRAAKVCGVVKGYRWYYYGLPF